MRADDAVGRYARILWDAREERRLSRYDALRLGRELGRAIYQQQEADEKYLAETDHRVRWCREVLMCLVACEPVLRADDPLEAVAAMLLGRTESRRRWGAEKPIFQQSRNNERTGRSTRCSFPAFGPDGELGCTAGARDADGSADRLSGGGEGSV